MQSSGQYIIIPLSSDLLQELISKAVQEGLRKFQKPHEDKLLSSKEVCEFLKISAPTLNKWASEGRINKHRIGSRVRYRESEINSALTTLKKYKQS